MDNVNKISCLLFVSPYISYDIIEELKLKDITSNFINGQMIQDDRIYVALTEYNLKELYDKYSLIKDIFDLDNDVLGGSVSMLMEINKYKVTEFKTEKYISNKNKIDSID